MSANTEQVRIKQVVPHAKNCWAIDTVERGDWSNPWWFPGRVVNRDAAGRAHKTAHRKWLVIQCNSTNCNGEILVRLDDLLDIIGRVTS